MRYLHDRIYERNLYPISYQLAIMLLITTGIRRTKLVNIQVKNINLKTDRILLTYTKSGKPRNIYICKEVKELLIKHLKNVKVYLFEEQTNNAHMNPANIHNIIKRLKKDLNIQSLSPHMFRHTYATALLENSADLESIRLLLGHSDYSMIMRYVHIKEKKLAEISTSFNPIKNTTKGQMN